MQNPNIRSNIESSRHEMQLESNGPEQNWQFEEHEMQFPVVGSLNCKISKHWQLPFNKNLSALQLKHSVDWSP